MNRPVAIVGMACQYPDARSPHELWENALAGRRAFRQIPLERLSLDDYLSPDHEDIDRTYCRHAAVLEGYEFDRSAFRVAGVTFRQTDMAHWLALDVAAAALADAGFPEGDGLPKDTTSVLIGNSLTGEFSRANLMRLRWPYVRHVVEGSLASHSWSDTERATFLDQLEQQYKQPFAEPGDETLAGGLSNTIAGRICNYFDLHGGGYTVDGACASSLLAVANACSTLIAGDADVVLAGGVDLSLDPFELVGFARVGALADNEMRVYDRRSAGFWPGEGCGMVVLMRADEAISEHRRIYGLIQGWGISSDGSGGLTRPEVAGQQLALRRAYRRAGFGIDTVGYVEGHGTGTNVGDSVELRSIIELRQEANPEAPPAVIGSVKAIIGHTKAAAGIAGLIKATMSVYERLLPPSTGTDQAHPSMQSNPLVLLAPRGARPWPVDRPIRASVSAMGFGGINTHVVLQSSGCRTRTCMTARQRALVASYQDAELFLFSERDRSKLGEHVNQVALYAQRLSRAELGDLATALAQRTRFNTVRAAIVASTPDQLLERLRMLEGLLMQGVGSRLDPSSGVMLGSERQAPSIGFLFPGQGSPSNCDGGIWRRRFQEVDALYDCVDLRQDCGDAVATDVAQLAITTAALAGLRVLDQLAIEADVSVGHSLGELVAYHWAGAIDEVTLVRIVKSRGKAMADCRRQNGTMASIAADRDFVEPLMDGKNVVIAGLNSPRQTIISGDTMAVDAVMAEAENAGVQAIKLRVSHAFHSPLISDAATPLSSTLKHERFHPLQRNVVSTITACRLKPNEDLRSLLLRQITSPVRFVTALQVATVATQFWIEVGPGNVMQGITRDAVDCPVISLDAGSESLQGLLQTVGMAFCLGTPVNIHALFDGRFTRPFDLSWQPKFLANPCELSSASHASSSAPVPPAERASGPNTVSNGAASDAAASNNVADETTDEEMTPGPSPRSDRDSLELVRSLVAARAELAIESVRGDDRLLSDIHLSSIAVGQLVSDAARKMNLEPPVALTDYANATVAEIATALSELVEQRGTHEKGNGSVFPSGVDSWVRVFTVELVERELTRRRRSDQGKSWTIFCLDDDPLHAGLQESYAKAVPSRGILVCPPADCESEHLSLLLEGVRATLDQEQVDQFVLVQRGRGGAAVARTLHLEHPKIPTCVVHVPRGDASVVEWIAAETRAMTDGYSEVYYDAEGTRREPRLRLVSKIETIGALPLCPDDVLLVSGGGKGIAAECGLKLARETGVRLALVGRSLPDRDEELATNLQRMLDQGATVRYVAADVTDREAVGVAIQELQSELGPITAVLHGAGKNNPKRLSDLTHSDFRETLAPKVDGLSNVLAAVDGGRLRLLITFGSIIARTGMPGEADYALANEWLTDATHRWHLTHPHCRCLAIEWSVWSGVGMGQRLGRIDALSQQGISAISTDQGVEILVRLVNSQLRSAALIVTGRFGQPATLRFSDNRLPLYRFLEDTRVSVPGVELIVDVNLSQDTDPYLADHVYQGVPLLPAVLGLEAMAQVAKAVTQLRETPVVEFRDIQFIRPIVVPKSGQNVIRIASLVHESGAVEMVVRSQETGFQTDHFRCLCQLDSARFVEAAHDGPSRSVRQTALSQEQIEPIIGNEYLPLDPDTDLYDEVLFHRGQFKCLRGYRHLHSKECIADVASTVETKLFGHFLPSHLVLGGAITRDATIHAIQACIPHGTLLPVGADRISINCQPYSGLCSIHARERDQTGDTFVYDVEVRDKSGRLREAWQGLRLRRVNEKPPTGRWASPLLGPYLERRIHELVVGTSVSVSVGPIAAHATLRDDSDQAIHRALGEWNQVHRRPDGKPELDTAHDISVAHIEGLTMAVASAGNVTCDAEKIVVRPEQTWSDMLGTERSELVSLIVRESKDDLSTAATRVWSAMECLKKSGRPWSAPLVLKSVEPVDCVLLASSTATILTWVLPVKGFSDSICFAVLVQSESIARSNEPRDSQVFNSILD